MSISQMIIASTGGAGGPPGAYPSSWSRWPIIETANTTVFITVENWPQGAPLYWTLDTWPWGTSVNPSADFYSTSGTIWPSAGYSIVSFTIQPVADNLLEGDETFSIKLGTYSGGNDLYYGGYSLIDTSVPATQNTWTYDSNANVWTFPDSSTQNPVNSGIWGSAVTTTFPDGTSYFTPEFNSDMTGVMSAPALTATGAWTTYAMTVQVWFYPTAYGTQLMSEVNPTFGYHYTMFEIDAEGYLKTRFYNNNERKSSNTVNLNAWNHAYISITGAGDGTAGLNGQNFSTYVGEPRTPPGAMSSNESVAVGYYDVTNMTAGFTKFQGRIAHIEVSDYATPSNFSRQRYHYRGADLDLRAENYNPAGSRWIDSSLNNTYVTVYNNPASTGTAPYGVVFDPASFQYAEGPNLGTPPNWTVESWFKLDSALTPGHAGACVLTGVYTSDTGVQYYTIPYSLGQTNVNTNFAAGFYDGVGPDLWHSTAGFIPNVGQWYHVVGTYDGTNIRQYINGSLTETVAYSGTPSGLGPIRIARRWDGSPTGSNFYFPGTIGTIKMYAAALGDSEIAAIFNNEKSTYGL